MTRSPFFATDLPRSAPGAIAPHLTLPPDLPARLQTTIHPYIRLNPRQGWIRLLSLWGATWGLWALAWLSGNFALFLALSVLGGIAYALLFVCTHDMAHNSLTGHPRLEAVIACCIGWPLLWSYGSYCIVHRFHHRWNGCDLRDPERVQWTEAEYAQATLVQQWYVQHQWLINIFLCGGVGLIFTSFFQGWRLGRSHPHLRSTLLRQLLQAALGGVAVHLIGFAWALSQGRGWDYVLFWLILERVTGIIMQSRGHLEHYGCWSPQQHPVLTQLYSGRNLTVPAWVNWLMGGLPYHSLHHAYPQIPFDRLPEAFTAVQAVLTDHQAPLPEQTDRGYLSSTLQKARLIQLIPNSCPNPATPESESIRLSEQTVL